MAQLHIPWTLSPPSSNSQENVNANYHSITCLRPYKPTHHPSPANPHTYWPSPHPPEKCISRPSTNRRAPVVPAHAGRVVRGDQDLLNLGGEPQTIAKLASPRSCFSYGVQGSHWCAYRLTAPVLPLSCAAWSCSSGLPGSLAHSIDAVTGRG